MKRRRITWAGMFGHHYSTVGAVVGEEGHYYRLDTGMLVMKSTIISPPDLVEQKIPLQAALDNINRVRVAGHKPLITCPRCEHETPSGHYCDCCGQQLN